MYASVGYDANKNVFSCCLNVSLQMDSSLAASFAPAPTEPQKQPTSKVAPVVATYSSKAGITK